MIILSCVKDKQQRRRYASTMSVMLLLLESIDALHVQEGACRMLHSDELE